MIGNPRGYGKSALMMEIAYRRDEISQRNETVQIYGASTRGGTIWQSLGKHIDAVDSAVERQVEKVGKYYSVIGKPIISEEQMRVSPPNYLLIGPWFLRNSFIDRESQFISAGGAMIFPLPRVEIIRNI
jgi:NDP-4-keto-2,6-dideoxyhexose 3-C-methyltransferase